MRAAPRAVAREIDETPIDRFAGAAFTSAAAMQVFAISQSYVPLPPAQNALRGLDGPPSLVLRSPIEPMSGERTPNGL
jgi:hypothetical protein